MGGEAARIAAFALAALAAACNGVGPAAPELVAALESCSDPADQARLVQAERALRQGDPAATLALARELIPRNPACARLMVVARRAVSDSPRRDRDKLKEEFRGLLAELLRATEAKVATATLSFGMALFASDEPGMRKWLVNATHAEPKHYFAMCKGGEDLLLRGELERANALLTKCVTLRDGLAEGWLLLARVAEDRGINGKAATHYETYLGQRPLDRQVSLDYVKLVLSQLRDANRCETVVAELYEQDPDNVDVALHRALSYYLQGQHGDAERVYQRVLKSNPREGRVVLCLGNLYHGAMNAPVKALQAYRYLMRLDKVDDAQAALNRLLFVPSRIKDIEKRLAGEGVALPAPPETVDDLIGTSATPR